MMIHASELSHADCTCLIPVHYSLTRLRCLAISWLDTDVSKLANL